MPSAAHPVTPVFESIDYQNGGCWRTPAGWVIDALALIDADVSMRMFDDMIRHLRSTDFRLHQANRGRCEWHHPDTGEHGVAVNMTSVTCPLIAVERILKEGLWLST